MCPHLCHKQTIVCILHTHPRRTQMKKKIPLLPIDPTFLQGGTPQVMFVAL